MIIGIDPASTKLAIAMSPAWPALDDVVWEEWKLPSPYTPQNPLEATRKLKGFLSGFDLLLAGGPATGFIEAPVVAGARNIQSTIKQSMVNGALQVALLELVIDARLVPITTWKHEVVGKGGANKDEVRAVIEQMHPTAEGESQDIIDALAVMEYGKRVVERFQSL